MEKSLPEQIADKLKEKLSTESSFSAEVLDGLRNVDLSDVEAVKKILALES